MGRDALTSVTEDALLSSEEVVSDYNQVPLPTGPNLSICTSAPTNSVLQLPVLEALLLQTHQLPGVPALGIQYLFLAFWGTWTHVETIT